MNSNLRIRLNTPLNLQQFSDINLPERVGTVELTPPAEPQMVLRMAIRTPYSNGYKLPDSLAWVWPALFQAGTFQSGDLGVIHPYCYVTVRHGPVVTETDDLWHVDGFSTRITHLPEANYVCVLGQSPTEYACQSFPFPIDFDPLRHNVHSYLQRRVLRGSILTMDLNTLYWLDPYVVHRRPPNVEGNRTFLRISFTPIEIPDINNTLNPLINTSHYSRDGIKDFRDHLTDYDESQV